MRTFTIISLLLISSFNVLFGQILESDLKIEPYNCWAYYSGKMIINNNQLYILGNATVNNTTPDGVFFSMLKPKDSGYELISNKNHYFQKPVYTYHSIVEINSQILTLTVNMANKFSADPMTGVLGKDYIPLVVKFDTEGTITFQSTDSISIRKKTIAGDLPVLCKNDKNEILQGFVYVDLKDSIIKLVVEKYDSNAIFKNQYEPLKFPIDSIHNLGLSSIVYIPNEIIYHDGKYYIVGEKRTWITEFEFKREVFYCSLNSDLSKNYYYEILLTDSDYYVIGQTSNILVDGENIIFGAVYTRSSSDTTLPTGCIFAINKSDGHIVNKRMFDNHRFCTPFNFLKCSDGNYLICGKVMPKVKYDPMTNETNSLLMKMDTELNIKWNFPSLNAYNFNDVYREAIEVEPNIYAILGAIDKNISLTTISDKQSDVSEDNFGNCTFIRKENVIYFKSSAEIIPKVVFIHDILGRKISEMIPNPSNGEIEISLNNLPVGSYFVSVIADGHQISKKYIVE